MTLPVAKLPESVELPSNVSSTAGAMIADTSYRDYDGPLIARAVRWGTIVRATIRQNVNKSRYGYWIPAVLVLLLYFISGAIFYVTQAVRNLGMPLPGDTGNPYALALYQSLMGTNILLFAATLTVGAGAIAADNRANALLVYLARPMTRTDYLIGKWVGVYVLLAALTVVPSFLMYLFFLTAYYNDGFLPQNANLLGRVLVAALIPPALNASLILGFSAWSKTPRLAGAAYAGFYFVLILVSEIVGDVLKERDTANRMPQTIAIVRNLSVAGIGESIGQTVLDVTPQQIASSRRGRRRNRRNVERDAPPPKPPVAPERAPVAPMLLIAGSLVVLPLTAAALRVRAVEVVKG